MVYIAPLIGAAVFLSGFAAALPTSDYSSSYGSSGSSDSSNSNYGSSDSSNSYGGSSDSSNSYGGSSDSSNSYGGSNYGSSNKDTSSSMNMYESSSTMNMYETSSTMNMEESSTMNMEESSTMNMEESSTMNMYETSSTMMEESSSTSSAYNSYETSSYGSGSSYWGGSGYQDCVNQCIAQFGGGSTGGGSYQATATSGSYGSKGTGSTHTVIVAPTKGVFRMMPFATNASVGDTIEFHWGADVHTVTKSSALTPCNKSSEAPVFSSGEQNKSFVFTQVVNDTNPTFYYCGTPGHCDKGMFGIINPQMAAPGSPSSLGGMMSSMAANDSDLSAYAAYSMNVTASNDQAAAWGSNFDMTNMPAWSHSLMATNVLFTRAALAMNSEVLKPDNSIDLSSVAATPLMLPKDITPALDAAASPPAGAAAAAGASPSGAPAADAAGAAATAAAPAASPSNGASSLASPRFLVGAVVVLATIFAL